MEQNPSTDPKCMIEGYEWDGVILYGEKCNGPYKINKLLRLDPLIPLSTEHNGFFEIKNTHGDQLYSAKLLATPGDTEQIIQAELEINLQLKAGPTALNIIEILYNEETTCILMEHTHNSFATEIMDLNKFRRKTASMYDKINNTLYFFANAACEILKNLHSKHISIGNASLSNISTVSDGRHVFIDFSRSKELTNDSVDEDYIDMIKSFFKIVTYVLGKDEFSNSIFRNLKKENKISSGINIDMIERSINCENKECTINMFNCKGIILYGNECEGPYTMTEPLVLDPFVEQPSHFFGVNSDTHQTPYTIKIINKQDFTETDIDLQITLQQQSDDSASKIIEVLYNDLQVVILMEHIEKTFAQIIIDRKDLPSYKDMLIKMATVSYKALAGLHMQGVVIGNASFSNISFSLKRRQGIFIDFSRAKKISEIGNIYDYLNMVESFFTCILTIYGEDVLSDVDPIRFFPTIPLRSEVEKIRRRVFKTVSTSRLNSRNCEQAVDDSGGLAKYNCFQMPPEHIRYIIGPYMFYEFNYKGKRIYLFGEIHNSLIDGSDLPNAAVPSNTLYFSSFVNSLVKANKEKTYDLMVETAFLSKSGQTSAGTPGKTRIMKDRSISTIFNMIVTHFHSCIDPKMRDQCDYPNLRVHYVDYRTEFSPTKEDHTKNVIDALSSLRMNKQLDNISDRTVVAKLKEYIQDRLTEADEEQIAHSALLMDMYGIARCLREFNIKDGGKQFSGTADTIIYYAGSGHIDNMVDFFVNYLGLNIISKSINTMNGPFIELDISSSSFIDRTNSKRKAGDEGDDEDEDEFFPPHPGFVDQDFNTDDEEEVARMVKKM